MLSFIIIIGIIAILVLLATIVIIQRRYLVKAKQLGDKKDELMALNVGKDLLETRKMSLTGQSLKDYQELESLYNEVHKNKYIQVDRQLNLVLNDAAGLNLWKTKEELGQLQSAVDEITSDISDVQNGLIDLHETSRIHQKAIEELHGSYAVTRQTIEDQASDFGPAYQGMLNFIDQLENDYQEFSELTNAGDQAAASDIYEQLGMETTQLETMRADIPSLFSDLSIKFVDQLAELSDGYQILVNQGVVFLDNSIPDQLAVLDGKRQKALSLLENLKIKEVRERTESIGQEIQDLYDTLQAELDAKDEFQRNTKVASQTMLRLREQNQALFIEAERLKQSYRLANHELERRRGYLEQIDMVKASVRAGQEQLDQHKITYSQALVMQKRWFEQFQEIDTNQTELWEQLRGLEPASQSAKKICYQYVDRIKGIKKRLERMNLPGLPAVYLEYFYNVSDEINRLANILDASLVDMDEVQRQLNIVAVDVDTLKEKTQQLVDDAVIAEQLLQYANRYRQSSETVARAIQEAREVYNNDHNYSKVMDILGPALDRVEDGIYDHIVTSYHRHQDKI